MRVRTIGTVLAIGMIALAMAVWLGWDGFIARSAVAELIACDEEQMAAAVARVRGLGPPGRRAIFAVLARDDAAACERVRYVLTAEDADDLSGRWADFSPAGRSAVLAAMIASGSDRARPLARRGTADPSAEVRARAVALIMKWGEPAPELLPLLSDPSAEVRRATLLAVGPHVELIDNDELLRWLHDVDAGVRSACELALRARGLRAAEVHFARMLTDPNPRQRLDLIAKLLADGEIDLAAWLRRLSHDPSPAVRAAVVRIAAEADLTPLADRLAQMAAADPDPSVRRNARYFVDTAGGVRPASGRR